jgi:hypothetical protein
LTVPVDQRKHVAGFGSIEAPEIFVVEDKEEAKKASEKYRARHGTEDTAWWIRC